MRILTTTFHSEKPVAFLYLDIETLPPQSGGHFDRILANIKPPGQYKKEDSIKAWMAENATAAAHEEHAKLALNGLYGEVCAIGWAIDDGDIFCLPPLEGRSESTLIQETFATIVKASLPRSGTIDGDLICVGHNINFDLQFLFQRAVRHGVRLPRYMAAAVDFKTERYRSLDTMRMWAGYKGFVKLKDLSRELLGDLNEDIDGSQVAEAWASDPLKVVEHCKADVMRVREIHKRFIAVL